MCEEEEVDSIRVWQENDWEIRMIKRGSGEGTHCLNQHPSPTARYEVKVYICVICVEYIH